MNKSLRNFHTLLFSLSAMSMASSTTTVRINFGDQAVYGHWNPYDLNGSGRSSTAGKFNTTGLTDWFDPGDTAMRQSHTWGGDMDVTYTVSGFEADDAVAFSFLIDATSKSGPRRITVGGIRGYSMEESGTRTRGVDLFGKWSIQHCNHYTNSGSLSVWNAGVPCGGGINPTHVQGRASNCMPIIAF